MTYTQRVRSDLATADRRDTADKAKRDNRIRNDELTTERRSESDEVMRENRLKNDEITADRRETKDRNQNGGSAIFFLVLAVLVLGTVFVLI